jgi:putative sigma-54 modulation protein
MTIEYTGRHTVVTADLRALTEAALERIALVTNRCTSAHIILTEDKHRKLAEVSLLCRGEQHVATGVADAMETALRQALDKVEQQAIRHKERYATSRDHRTPLAAL